jgi:hypothetical protein
MATEKQFDVWTLVQNGYFNEACTKADFEYNLSGDIFSLRNKVYALFHLKEYEECVILTQNLITASSGQTDVDFIFCGIANWLLDKKEEAIMLWVNAEQSLYKDAAGGIDIQVFLYFASVKINDNGLKKNSVNKIKKLLKSRRSVNWPGPLGHFLTGEMDENNLLNSVSSIPILRERHLCQVHFAIAIKRLEVNDMEGYANSLRKCISYGPASYVEQVFYLAKGELEKLNIP